MVSRKEKRRRADGGVYASECNIILCSSFACVSGMQDLGGNIAISPNGRLMAVAGTARMSTTSRFFRINQSNLTIHIHRQKRGMGMRSSRRMLVF